MLQQIYVYVSLGDHHLDDLFVLVLFFIHSVLHPTLEHTKKVYKGKMKNGTIAVVK